MRTRELSGQTLGEVADELRETKHKVWGGATFDIGLYLEDQNPFFTLGNNEVPVTGNGLEALAKFADIPTKFLLRVDPDEQAWILRNRLERLPKPDTRVFWDDLGIQEVRPANETRVAVEDLVESALGHLGEDATVDTWWSNADDFRVDVVTERVQGGDVGDLTQGGVRIGQDRSRNLAPWVQPYLLRLVCTNGMEVPDHGLKVDTRKADEDEILMLFGNEVRRAFSRVEGDIAAFYDLKDQHFTDGRAALNRIASEAGVPARTIARIDIGDEATMFDIVNAMTGYANGLNPHSSSYRTLQVAGGSRVYDHAERCENCLSRI